MILDILATDYMKADQLKDQTIIHGTLRCEDLYPIFRNLLVLLDPDKAQRYDEAGDVPTDDETWELLFELDSIAPEGYYFGSHPGDGSDFGFWKSEENQ